MFAKIKQGGNVRGCINYVTRCKLDLPDGTPSKDWRIIGNSADVRTSSRNRMATDISRPQSLRKAIKEPCGHISLDFHAADKPKLSDEMIVKIAEEYMDKMGIKDTPYIIVRHLDKNHPHCHLVFSRVDYNGKIIDTTTNFKRNKRVCLAITERYGLQLGEDKLSVDPSKLRGKEKVRYQVAQDIRRAISTPDVHDWASFTAELSKYGITTEERISKNGRNNLYYRKGKYSFWSVKLHKEYSRRSIEKSIAKAHPRIESTWLNPDGTVKPLSAFRGVRLTVQQQADYVAGKVVRLDGCSGPQSTVYIRFDREAMRPKTYSSNPETATHIINADTPSLGLFNISQNPMSGEGYTNSGSDNETFQQFRANHPGMTYAEALRAWKAKKRGKHLSDPNTMDSGGPHL